MGNKISSWFSCLPCLSGNTQPPSTSHDASSSAEVASSSFPTEYHVKKILEAAAVDEENGIVNLEGLIQHISDLLDFIREAKRSIDHHLPKSSVCVISKEVLSEAIEAASSLKDISSVLKGIGQAHWVTAGLVVVSTILERVEAVINNREECLDLLDEMYELAKYVKQLQERPVLTKNMEDLIPRALYLIVKASIMCCVQIVSPKRSRFFSASVDKAQLVKFKQELEKMRRLMKERYNLCMFDMSMNMSMAMFYISMALYRSTVRLHEDVDCASTSAVPTQDAPASAGPSSAASSSADCASANSTVSPAAATEEADGRRHDPHTVPSASASASAPPFQAFTSHDASSSADCASTSAVPTQDAPASGGPSSSFPTESDIIKKIREAVEVDEKDGNGNLEGLIQHISELLEFMKKNELDKKRSSDHHLPKSSVFVKSKEVLSEAIEAASSWKDVTSFVKAIGQAHWATAGLLVVSSVLERFEAVSANRYECLRLLDEMYELAKYVKQLQERPRSREDMEDLCQNALEMIVEAFLMCCVQISSSKFSRFFSASVDKGELLKFL